VLGAALQVDRNHPAAVSAAGARPDEPLFSPAVVEDPLDPPRDDAEPVDAGMFIPFDGDADLVDRAAYDESRLHASGNGYTLQFAVNCEAKNVRANLEGLEQYQEFYLLTMLYEDRACFRLCWGFYDNKRQAQSDRKIPEQLRGMTDKPKVISVAEALP
jgi:hypothetical protein